MTTMSEMIERNNKKSAIDKAMDLKKVIAKTNGTYVKARIDISDARERVKTVNEAIKEYNEREGVEKLDLIKTSFTEKVSKNDKLFMTLTVNSKGLDATIGTIRLRYELNADDWKEVKAFSIESECESVTKGQREFLTEVSNAARKLAHSYGLENMNVDKRVAKIVGMKLKECEAAINTIEANTAVKVEKAAV